MQCGEKIVLIPLKSGLGWFALNLRNPAPVLGLNPFEIRAGLVLCLFFASCWTLSLNPFEIRAGLVPAGAVVPTVVSQS